MFDHLMVLCGTAAVVGTVHTLLGPDHYLPFIAMSRAGRWSAAKTCIVAAACGAGHVAGSVILGVVGIALGTAVFSSEALEAVRGEIAAWMLMAFGLTYAGWGLRRAMRSRPHTHWHTHGDGVIHTHQHVHDHAHAHVHAGASSTLTPWVLFSIFIFGPCEPLIPLMMYPAAKGDYFGVAVVTLVFALVTIPTMCAAVMLAVRFADRLRIRPLERFGHALAGATVLACGVAVRLGL